MRYRRQATRKRSSLRAAAGAVLAACLSGCMIDFENPIGDGGPIVNASPYIGKWVLKSVMGKPEVEGAKVVVESAGPNLLKLHATLRSGRLWRLEGRLAGIEGAVFLSGRETAEDGGGDYPWLIVRLDMENAGKKVVVKDMSPIDARQFVESGQIEGDVIESGMLTEYTVSIEAAAGEVRTFVATHAAAFDVPLVELERVE